MQLEHIEHFIENNRELGHLFTNLFFLLKDYIPIHDKVCPYFYSSVCYLQAHYCVGLDFYSRKNCNTQPGDAGDEQKYYYISMFTLCTIKKNIAPLDEVLAQDNGVWPSY